MNFFLFLFILCFNSLEAQELPPVLNFSPDVYGAENQNWSIAQAANEFIYVANNSGLLEYDGAKWRLYPSPNQTIMRSVAVVNDRIYTGSYMQFGYWVPNDKGLLSYTSLSDSLKVPVIEDEQFWNIIAIDQLILFQSLNRIYSYDTVTHKFAVIESQNPITRSFKIENTIYFQQEHLGLFTIQDGRAVLVSDDAVFKKDILVDLSKWEDGFLVVTQRSGIFTFNQKQPIPFEYALNEAILNETIYSSKQLADGSIMLGTIASGLIHLTADGNFDYEINQKKGLINNTVLAIYEDKNQNVWLGLDNGISAINTNTAFKVYTDNDGTIGSVYASAKVGDFIYLGTNQGLFYKNLNESSSKFNLIPETKGQVWSLNKLGDALFCCHHEGTFLVSGKTVNRIADIPGTWQIQWLDKTKGLAIQGNYNGLYVLQKTELGWKLRNKLSGFDISSRYFGKANDNVIYVSHEYKGVFKLNVNPDFREVSKYRLVSEISKAEKAGILGYKEELIYVSDQGIYTLNTESDKFEIDSVLTKGFLKVGNYVSGKLNPDETGDKLWGFNDQEVFYFEPGILEGDIEVRRISLPSKNRKDIPGFENITYLSDNTYLLGNSTGYILINLDKLNIQEYEINLRNIKNGTFDDRLNNVSITENATFNYQQNSFIFNYSVTDYNKYRSVNYQFRLAGYYDEWSSWSSTPQTTFENLPYGTYTFEVKARIGDQLSNNTASYSFTIKRPWYLSLVAIIIYVLLLIGLFTGIQFWNQNFYRKQKERLIEINQRKLELAQSESERKVMALENEKLQQDVESKNRELAASTMNIVKKNELLNSIKKELEPSSKNPTENSSVIKIIDKNLNPKKDWEFFKEAFNNADKDFLKKIKGAHPKLTPNDLKLCAYLRLNLSSKEIAPLLNISVRSVEIKRYRLRKKMDMEHEESLVEYILSI